jgi:hypothetical protein
MSANVTATARIADRVKAVPDTERAHRLRLRALYVLAFATNLAIFIYGFDYYKLSAIDRPFSLKHHMLRPSGPIVFYLGFAGVALFVGISLYPIRKHWKWPSTIGSTRHWLDIHVLMGHRPSLDAEIQRHRRHGLLDYVRGLCERRARTISLRVDPAQGDHRRTVDEGIAGVATTSGVQIPLIVGGIYLIRSSRDMATVSPTSFPIAWRMSARTGSLCVPLPRAMNELRKGWPLILPLTFTNPRVPKNLTESGQTT